MTKEDWCDMWKVPEAERDAAWEAKCQMDERLAGWENIPSHAVRGDMPDFVSPIDGTVVSGRAALREHCLKHDVVLTADLKGLPMKTMNNTQPISEKYREETRRTIAEVINSRNY